MYGDCRRKNDGGGDFDDSIRGSGSRLVGQSIVRPSQLREKVQRKAIHGRRAPPRPAS